MARANSLAAGAGCRGRCRGPPSGPAVEAPASTSASAPHFAGLVRPPSPQPGDCSPAVFA